MAYVYRDSSTLASAARLALWADALVAGGAVVLTLTMGADALLWGDLARWYAMLQLVTWLVSTALFLIWFYRANANARAMGAEDLMGSPGLSVAWFFIPLAWFFMPYVVVRDTWKASEAPRDWQGRRAPPLIGFWWAAMLIANLAGSIAFMISVQDDYASFDAVGAFNFISDVGKIGVGLLGAQVVAGIHRRQINPVHLSDTFR